MFRKIRQYLKTLYFNFKHLPFEQAKHLPIYIGANVQVDVKGQVIIEGSVARGMITLGAVQGSRGVPGRKDSYLLVDEQSTLRFRGKCRIVEGFTIRLDNKAELSFGNLFRANKNWECYMRSKLTIGDGVRMGWNVHIRDCDGGRILNEHGEVTNSPRPITIGRHCWIASYATIMKGVTLPDDTVVAFRSMVTKSFTQTNTIIAGVPAKVVKENSYWDK